MQFLVAYTAAITVFAAMDTWWTGAFMRDVLNRDVPGLLARESRAPISALFYVGYTLGLVYFAVMPAHAEGNVGDAARNGAFVGLLAYWTYETTNLATLRGWTLRLVLIDMAWGAFLSAAAATFGFYAASLL